MKKILILLFLVLLIPVLSYSQINFATAGVYGGIMLPMGDFSDVYKASPTVGAEGYYSVTQSIDIVADVAYNFLSSKQTYTNTNFYYLESTAGIRYNFTPTKEKVFAEAEIGAYTFGAKFTYYDIYGTPFTVNTSTTDFGLNVGVGAVFPISSNFAITGKAKFHNVFTSGSSTNYFGLTAGFDYKFR